MKVRLDKLLVDRGLAQSRERAQALVLAGKVLVNGQKGAKPGVAVDAEAAVQLLGQDLRYVSRGGVKLEAALQHWKIEVNARYAVDVGASTGGFTDCLLQHGAAGVLAIDTGYGQMDYRLRQDPRVALLERTNARYLTPEDIKQKVDIVAMDVSFISATLLLPAVWAAVKKSDLAPLFCDFVVLVKPQFEAGREYVAKGGIVRDVAAQQRAIDKVIACLRELGAKSPDCIESPIQGMEGNREFLVYARFERL
jgi:23S rRNA (cytidine1920-2'-O)/16S rRNA (cytidine1409-2'-O)-methyltransferase